MSGCQARRDPGRGSSRYLVKASDSLVRAETSQRSCTTKPRVSPSLSLLEEDDPESLAQHPQTASSPPLGNFDLSQRSLVALEYLPFFRTYEHLLAEETLTAQPEICWDQGGGPSFRETPFPEDSDPPSGFFPYYHSKEETFPSLAPPGRLCGSFQDPPTRREVQAGCFCRMTDSRCSAALAGPDFISGSSHARTCCCGTLLVSARRAHDSCLTGPLSGDAVFRDHALCASGFVPYYRTPEEGLHTSPGPPACPSEAWGLTGELPRPGASYCEGAAAGGATREQAPRTCRSVRGEGGCG
nr:uncharacterized protein LOC118971962 [Manis javanica]